MAEFSIKPAELAAKAGDLRSLNDQLRAKCAEYAEKGNALSSSFEGDTASAFYKEVGLNSGKMSEFISLVENYCKTMEEDAATYMKADSDAANILNGSH